MQGADRVARDAGGGVGEPVGSLRMGNAGQAVSSALWGRTRYAEKWRGHIDAESRVDRTWAGCRGWSGGACLRMQDASEGKVDGVHGATARGGWRAVG